MTFLCKIFFIFMLFGNGELIIYYNVNDINEKKKNHMKAI